MHGIATPTFATRGIHAKDKSKVRRLLYSAPTSAPPPYASYFHVLALFKRSCQDLFSTSWGGIGDMQLAQTVHCNQAELLIL